MLPQARPPDFAQGLPAGAVGGEIGHVDGDARQIRGRAAGLAQHEEHLVQGPRELLRESGRGARGVLLPARLSRDEEEPRSLRSDQPVVPALGFAQGLGVHDPEAHRALTPPPNLRRIACPVSSLPPAQRSITADATSSGLTSRSCPAEASTAARASSRGRSARASTFASVRSVMGVSTYPGQTAFTVTPVPASSRATERVKPSTACLAAL